MRSTSTRARCRRELRPPPPAASAPRRGRPRRRRARTTSRSSRRPHGEAGAPARAAGQQPARPAPVEASATAQRAAIRRERGGHYTPRRGRRTLLPHDADLLRQRDPHIGHAYTTIMADIIARHHRQRGEDVFFLTGTDEHGGKIAARPSARGARRASTPTCCRRASGPWAACSTPPTTSSSAPPTPSTRPRCSASSSASTTSGDIYKGSYGGWYCTSCEAFYAEDDLLEGRLCPVHSTPVEWLEEENWFFRLSAYRDRLLAHYDANPGWVLPPARLNEARRMIEDGPRGPLGLAGPGRVGRPGAVGPGPDGLRLDRRPPQLPHRPRLRAAGRGPGRALLAAGPAAHGQGHPQVPRRHLAGAADGRRPRAAAAADDPRLRAQGRREDEQDHRQRGRPVPVHRARTASTRCATTWRARCASARTAPSPPRASRRATRGSWRTSSATCSTASVSMIGRYRDGVVPADGGRRRASWRPRSPAAAEALRRRLRPRSTSRAAAEDVWRARAAAQPAGGAARPVDPRQGPGARRRARPDALQPRRGPAGRRPSCCGRSSPARPSASWRRSARTRPTSRSPRAAWGAGAPGATRGARRPALPARGGGGGVVDTHAHLDSCDAPTRRTWSPRRVGGGRRADRRPSACGRESSERAVALAEAHPEVYAAVGVHPHDADGFTPADVVWIARAGRATRGWWPSASAASTTTATTPAREAQRRAFSAQIGLAREAGPAAGDPHARRGRRDARRCCAREAEGPPGGAPLLLAARSASTRSWSAATC